VARMIPLHLPTSEISPGEVDVFVVLRDDPGTSDWVVFHSYDLPKDRNGRRHEIDFVVLVPGCGIAVLEIKAHKKVSRLEDGTWVLGKEKFSTARNPVSQLLDNSYELRRKLETVASFLKVAPLLVFTDAAVETELVGELNPENLFSPAQGPMSKKLVEKILTAISKESGHLLGRHLMEAATSFLRPSFEALASPVARRDRAEQEIHAATAEQFRVLDAVSENRRLLVEGPPGSGKTTLATEIARRASVAGKSARIVSFGGLLGRQLATNAAGQFAAGSFFSYVLSKIDEVPPKNPSSDWWRGAAKQALSLLNDYDCVDFLVVDEFQDLINPEFVSVLDAMVVGGLGEGRWVLLGDSTFQNIHNFRPTDFSLLPQNFARVSLRQNCRNPRTHGEWLEKYIGDRIYEGYRRAEAAPMPGIAYSKGNNADAIRNEVNKKLGSFKPSEITVLVVDSAREKEIIKTLGYQSYHSAATKVTVATVRTFKGLEAPAVIVEASLSWSSDLTITSLTRATESLTVLFPEREREQIWERLTM